MTVINQWGRYVQPKDIERLLGNGALEDLRTKGVLECQGFHLRVVSEWKDRGPAASKKKQTTCAKTVQYSRCDMFTHKDCRLYYNT